MKAWFFIDSTVWPATVWTARWNKCTLIIVGLVRLDEVYGSVGPCCHKHWAAVTSSCPDLYVIIILTSKHNSAVVCTPTLYSIDRNTQAVIIPKNYYISIESMPWCRTYSVSDWVSYTHVCNCWSLDKKQRKKQRTDLFSPRSLCFFPRFVCLSVCPYVCLSEGL